MKKGEKCYEISQTTPVVLCVVYFDNGHSSPRNIEAPKIDNFVVSYAIFSSLFLHLSVEK